MDKKYTALKEALIKAKEAAMAAKTEDYGGTCNFDSPVLLYKEMGYNRNQTISLIESLGMMAWEPSSSYWKGCIVISGVTAGQGFCRTRMAEAFAKSLKASGIESGVYYQMD